MVDGAMNRHRYIQILRNQMLPLAMGVFGRNFVCVHNNAPPHTARNIAVFFDEQDVKFMHWPALSPDMKPIEHVWDQMSVWIRDMRLFWPLEAGTHATSVPVSEGQYHVPPICSELFQCA